MTDLALMWDLLAPARSLLAILAVIWIMLAAWVIWGWRKSRSILASSERALDVMRRTEERETTLPPLPAFRQFPSECPWRPEEGHARFRETRRTTLR